MAILEACCDPSDRSPGSLSFLTGSRIFETHLYEHTSFPFNLIGPVSVIWRPEVSSEATAQTTSTKGKEKEKVLPPATRAVWVKIHPDHFDTAFLALKTSITHYLIAARRAAAGALAIEVEIADLRNKINIFEIMGPKANQVLKGSLSPVSQDKRQTFTDVRHFSSLTLLTLSLSS